VGLVAGAGVGTLWGTTTVYADKDIVATIPPFRLTGALGIRIRL
jgi:hypothetical protein